MIPFNVLNDSFELKSSLSPTLHDTWKHPQNLSFQGKRIHLKMLFRVWTLKILEWTILGGDDSKQHTHGHGPQLQSRPFYDFASLWNVYFRVFSKRYICSFFGNLTLALSLFHRKLLLKTHGREWGNPRKNWTPKVATPQGQSYWPCSGQRTGDYRQLQQLFTKANKTKVKHCNPIASSIISVLHNWPKYFCNLIGSYLWSIWWQTHGWRH